MKEKLQGALGAFGLILFYAVSIFFVYAPLIFLDFSFLIKLLLIGIVLVIPIIGNIVNLVLWIWAFIVVVGGTIDGWAIAFFIVFAFYTLTSVVPFLLNLVASIISTRRES